MTGLSLQKIAEITGAELFQGSRFTNKIFTRIITDSRTFFDAEDSIFFALIGPRNNGHHYIQSLIEKGISAFVVSDKKFICPGHDFLLVDDTTHALQKLARFNRNLYDYPVVGITGSNGKTIIKEWLAAILAGQFNIVRNPKSYNSQIGVPLSVMLMEPRFDLGIFEAGISQAGEMEKLAQIIQPSIGIFTNIGDAHQEGFESTAQKTFEKLKLFKSCKQLIYCEDNEKINRPTHEFCKMNYIEEVSWSFKNRNSAIHFSSTCDQERTYLTAVLNGESLGFSIPFTDSSSVENACHCFAAASVLSNNIADLLPVFSTLYPVEMRLEIKQGINNCLLVNDYYNSDLNSLTIALSVLHQQAAKEHLNRLVILSDIQQTGLPSEELYRQVNKLLADWKIDGIIGIGPEISAYAGVFSVKKSFYVSLEDFQTAFNRKWFQSAAILIKGARKFTFEKISSLLQFKAHQTQLEIDLNALTNNLNVFKKLLNADTKIMVMVKAFSYGSGDVEIANALQFQNVHYLAVAVTDEGVLLRNAGIRTPIIVMNPETESFQQIIDFQLEPNIYSYELLDNFSKAIYVNQKNQFPVHLKIDTGMNRLGFKDREEIRNAVKRIIFEGKLIVKSVFTHLAASDDPAFDDFTYEQFSCFEEVTKEIFEMLPYKPDRHILNSAGIERFPEKQYEMVRLGIGLYGISSTGLLLQNIGTLRSTISQVKKVKVAETVGYSRRGKINRESEIAVIPLGYADGIDRKLGNGKGSVFVHGQKVPIIGNICMDMLMFDVTGLGVKTGERVEIFGSNISIAELAEKAGTIPYEILTGISQRVKRVYLQE